jgi:aspartate racemase
LADNLARGDSPEGGANLRKLGIIGGTGWTSTALYYEHINRGIGQRLGGLHSARLAMESLDFGEYAALEQAGKWDAAAQMNVDAAKRLVAGGAEGVLMACNTSHKFYDIVAAAIDVPLLHIADAAADRLVAERRTNVAVLGTRFTMTEDFIRGRIEARGITLVPIEETWIREVDRIIFDELAAGRVVRDSQRSLKTFITELAKRKTQAVLLACTELVFAVDCRANVIPVYDTTAIHARAAVDWMLADEEEARAAA